MTHRDHAPAASSCGSKVRPSRHPLHVFPGRRVHRAVRHVERLTRHAPIAVRAAKAVIIRVAHVAFGGWVWLDFAPRGWFTVIDETF